MAELTLAEILNMPVDDIKEPVALPTGTYLCIVDGQPEFAKVGQNQTDCVNFNLKPMQAMQDVDQKALSESLNGDSLTEKKIRHRLFLTKDAVYRLKKFLTNDLGIQGNNFAAMIPESMGKQVYAKLTHQSSQDGSTIYHNVAGTAKV